MYTDQNRRSGWRSATAKSRSNCRRVFDASLYSHGRVRTALETAPKTARRNTRESDAVCTVELDARWRKALRAWRPRATSFCFIGWTRPRRESRAAGAAALCRSSAARSALRSPVRPNPIAVAVARLVRIRRRPRLSVVGIDCLDNTPLLDIKPYFVSTDSRAGRRGGVALPTGSADRVVIASSLRPQEGKYAVGFAQVKFPLPNGERV